ncbi:MAG: CvpA family protein [Bryobacteraceae bacterium]
MNWLDIVLSIILLLSTIAGLRKGFVRTVVGFVSTFLGILLAVWFYEPAGAMFREYASHPFVANAIGFGAVLVGTILAGWLLSFAIARILKWAGLGWMDALLGGVLGLARGALVAAAIVLAISSFTRNPPPSSITQSNIAPYILEFSKLVSYVAPADLRTNFDQNYAKIRKVWDEMVKLVPART